MRRGQSTGYILCPKQPPPPSLLKKVMHKNSHKTKHFQSIDIQFKCWLFASKLCWLWLLNWEHLQISMQYDDQDLHVWHCSYTVWIFQSKHSTQSMQIQCICLSLFVLDVGALCGVLSQTVTQCIGLSLLRWIIFHKITSAQVFHSLSLSLCSIVSELLHLVFCWYVIVMPIVVVWNE